MSYLLAQILVCLLIAGLIGAVIGWLLRGGCSRKLRDCEDEWKMKMGSLESEWNSKLNRQSHDYDEQSDKEMQAATLKRHAEHVEAERPSYSYEEELKEKLNEAQNTTNIDTTVGTTSAKSTLASVGTAGIAALATRDISLSTDKVNLYAEHGVDFEKDTSLEDDYDLHTLEGISHEDTQKLKTIGITSTKKLAELSKDAHASEKLAKTLNVESNKVASWIGKSCLLTLPGVDKKTAELMQNSGISSLEHIATTPPETLHRKMEVFNKEALIPVSLPDIKSVSLWSKIAKPLTAGSALSTAAVTTSTSSYAKELKAKLNPTGFDLDSIKELLINKGISLSEKKIKLYAEHGVDFEHTNNLEDNYYVESIEGIGSKYAQGLREMGIRTTQDLVKKLSKNHDAIDQIAKTLNIQPSELSSWISMADLIQLPGVDAQAAELMQTVGISTTRELGITNANSLHGEMLAFNKKSPIVPEIPSISSLSLWSKIAKLLG